MNIGFADRNRRAEGFRLPLYLVAIRDDHLSLVRASLAHVHLRLGLIHIGLPVLELDVGADQSLADDGLEPVRRDARAGGVETAVFDRLEGARQGRLSRDLQFGGHVMLRFVEGLRVLDQVLERLFELVVTHAEVSR